ncbi:MAG: helix-turn-helix transcriptional regulator [Bacteroidia bacterium]|nr:helix-turn-helix transcriptional regulator [Bacteroidia bacterium]
MVYVRHNKGLKRLGNKIKEIRLQQKISQDQLSFESGISKNQISRIERGEINTGVSTLLILAEVLNVHIKEFFTDN